MPLRLRIHWLLLAAFAIGGTSARLSAQAPAAVSTDTTDTARLETGDVDPRFLVRVFPAVGMGAAGAFLGGLGGLVAGYSTESLGVVVLGLIAGATVGGAMGAAAPKGRGLCTENQRFWRALAGATLGLAAGASVVWNEPERYPLFAATIPVGSVMLLTHC